MIIRDAIHGSIEFSPIEERVLDSPLVQRLRYVKQLSTAYLVFPSAQHTRLEHSVGAMHLTGRLCSNLGVEPTEAELLRLAALLHDVGHGAFAHDIEPLMRKYTGLDHEERGIRLVKDSELAQLVEDAGFSLKALRERMEGKGRGSMLVSDVGTDRIDYLLRDAYFTGVAYSLIDADRLLRTLALHGNDIVVTEKGRLAAESLLVSRYFMFNVVYYHPAARIAGAMVVKAADSAIRDKKLAADEVMAETDCGLLVKLKALGYGLAGRVFDRRLFKKALVVDAGRDAKAKAFFAGKGAFEAVNDAMADAGFDGDEFVACMPMTSTRKLHAKLLNNDGKLEELTANSDLMKALESERREAQFILATDESGKEKAAAAVRKLF